MRVIMITTVAGPDFSASAGKEIDIDKKTAEAWIEGGFAKPAQGKTPRALETAPIVQPETAAIRASRQAVHEAGKHKIDLSGLVGTGRDGLITIADVRARLAAAE
mgnify:CR=1 FL=1